MYPVIYTVPILGGIKIFGYGLMLFIAYMAATNLAAWLARREKLNPEVIHDLALGVFLGGLIGARLFYVIQYWGDKVQSFADIFKIWEGGIVLYGSIIGGTIAFFAYRLIRPFPFLPYLDAIAPALALGIAIGRIGCFLNGCCYGDTCSLPWAVSFPEPSPPWAQQHLRNTIPAEAHWSLPVHPTQLYSTIDGLLLMTLALAYYPLRRRDGEVMALLMVTYPVSRLLIEILRSDEAAIFAGMTISQNISTLLMVAGGLFWYWLSRQPAGRVADAAEETEPLSLATA